MMVHRLIALVAGLLLLVLSSQAVAADCTGAASLSDRHFVTTQVRLRSWSSTYSATFAVLPVGQSVRVRSNEGEWSRVDVPSLSLSGYIASRYLSETCTEGVELTRATLPADQIAEILMAQSRSRYSGSCPCPDSVDRGGRRCGGRSAYSRPGGASPLCYRRDVSAAMIERFRTGSGR